MASTFKFHSQINEVVPWQAQYTFPTQSTKVTKQCVKLPPKNGGSFIPGNIIRIEFPSDQYLNCLNSVFQFDMTWSTATGNPRLQRGGAHNVIKRLRVIYGSLVLEDIQEYKTLVRILTESGVQQDYMTSTGSILDGMFETMVLSLEADNLKAALTQDGTSATANTALLNTTNLGPDLVANLIRPSQSAATDLANGTNPRTYCLNLLSGILTCKKLIPLKWMAAQLAIEITLADPNDAALFSVPTPSYTLTNVNFISEMLEFDSSYDIAFFDGLTNGGVPLKFDSWHFHSFSAANQTNILQIHERARSVKTCLAVSRSTNAWNGLEDSDRFFHALGQTYTAGVINSGTEQIAAINDFQFRVGGRYYPSQPVKAVNGGAEAMVELMKALNSLGDYTKASNITYKNWTSAQGGGQGSKFIMAAEFENTDALPDTIAGINAEEQSDIALSVNLSGAPVGKKFDIFMHYDAMLIVMPNNQVSLVQ